MGVLEGKAAVIVGGGRGIGRAVALLFASEGARVLVNDLGCDADGSGADPGVARAVAGEITARGGTAVSSAESVGSESAAEGIVAAAQDAFGRLDAVVHTAGISTDQVLLRADAALFARALSTHLEGAFHLTRAAARAMQREGGRIVLTTSAAGLVGNFGQVAYSASAAGVYGLMRAASIELQRSGVFVNAVAPLAKTRLTEGLPMFEHVATMTPEHVAPAYLFFGSDLSSDLTGNVLGIAGGRISLYKVTETSGRFKEAGDRVWTAQEIQEHWPTMGKP